MNSASTEGNLTAFFFFFFFLLSLPPSDMSVLRQRHADIRSLASASIFNRGIWPCLLLVKCLSLLSEFVLAAMDKSSYCCDVEIDVLVQLPTSPGPSVEWHPLCDGYIRPSQRALFFPTFW